MNHKYPWNLRNTNKQQNPTPHLFSREFRGNICPIIKRLTITTKKIHIRAKKYFVQ